MTTKLDSIEFDKASKELLGEFKSAFMEIMTALEEAQTTPRCHRSATTALVHLEEAYMWVEKTLRDAQTIRAAVEDETKYVNI